MRAAILSWTPNNTQGGKTNLIQLIVQDNGSPSLSVTQSFSIVVLDTTADLTVMMSKTNVLAGETNQLSIWLNTGWQLTNLTFIVETDPTRLTNLTLAPLASGLISATLAPAGEGRSQLIFEANPSQPLAGSAQLAWLNFEAGTVTFRFRAG